MSCLKCGKKTNEDQVFCDICLASMDAYPVKPDIHVQLPNRPAVLAVKKSGRKRRALTPEEQVAHLQSRVRRLRVLVMLLILLLSVISAMLAHTVMTHEDLDIGKNYTFVNPFE